MEIDIKLNKKQSIAYQYLIDNDTTEVLYGGGVFGGKTYLLSIWVISQCLQYDGVKYLVGRTRLTALKLTTLATILQVLSSMGLKTDEHYKYNAQSNIITFLHNDSQIILKDLEQRPSDPDFDSLGSLEITGAAVDESSQITRKVYDVLKSRIRYKLKEHNLKPKLLLTTNPSIGWLKTEFYTPYKEGTLPTHKKFVQSLATDNPYLTDDYLKNLRTLPERQRKRLLEGDWSYDDSSDNLFGFDDIIQSFNKHQPNPNDKIYASLDVARFGTDQSVLVIWKGLTIMEITLYSKLDTNQLYEKIKERMTWYNIHPKQMVVDSDGIGGGITDLLHAVPFVNNSRPLNGENYNNLKSQCYVTLSQKMKDISINIDNIDIKDRLTSELLLIKLKDVEKDNKVSVIPKEEMIKISGKSPDIADAIMMGMYFHLKNKKTTGRYSISIL